MIRIEVVGGNIADIPSDAIVAAVNSGKEWQGAVDRAIQARAGDYFHSQILALEQTGRLVDGAACLAGALPGTQPPATPFENVIFVIDDLVRPLQQVILQGLQMARHDTSIRHLSLPLMHTGMLAILVARYRPEENPYNELARALRMFIDNPVPHVERITVVVYGDPRAEHELGKVLNGTY